MPWIKGTDLSPAQRADVLKSFQYRWTIENVKAQIVGKRLTSQSADAAPPEVQVAPNRIQPTTSDETWLSRHAFYFRGGRLEARRGYLRAEHVHLSDAEIRREHLARSS